MMKRLLKLVAIATVAAAWNPFGRRKARDATTTTTTTTPGTCDASDEACAAAAAEADALERLAALERAASVPAGAGRPSAAPQKWKAVAVSADGSRRVALESGGTFANDFRGTQGRKRVIQRRFNVSVPRARVPGKASTLRERSEE